MTNAVRAQITAGPSESASLLMDLNDDDPWFVLHDGLSLGAANNGEREITLKLEAEAGDVSQAMSALMRAANRAEAYFCWQSTSSSAPTWFRILDTVSTLNFGTTFVDDGARQPCWTLPLSLTVDEAGYGERVTLPPITISNADLGVTIPHEIKGDYDTAARIDVRPLGVQSWGGWRSLVNVTPVLPSCPLGAPGAAGAVVATPLPPVITWEAEAFTPSAGTTVHSSGGLSGGQALKFDETDGTWRPILSGVVPITPPPGTYQVWARVWRSSLGAGGAQLRIGHFSWTQPLDIRTAKFNPPAGESHISWIMLGDMAFPAGMPSEGLTGDDMDGARVWVYGKGLSLGTAGGTIMIDRFALVPRQVAQGGKGVTALATWGISGPAGLDGGLWNAWRIDGDYRRSGLINVFRKWFTSGSPPQWTGGYPVLSPGMRNIVTVLHRTNQTGTGSDDLAASVEVVISYHPRVAHLAS